MNRCSDRIPGRLYPPFSLTPESGSVVSSVRCSRAKWPFDDLHHVGRQSAATGQAPTIPTRVGRTLLPVGRTIPTRVGRTLGGYSIPAGTTDHPHARGENEGTGPQQGRAGGPSPRAWGQPPVQI